MSNNSKLVKPENTLKKKVGTGGFNESDLVKAQQGLEKKDIDFRPQANDFLAELDATLEKIKTKEMPEIEQLDAIMYPMMQLKSQGGLFQYPLITKISHATLDFLENISGIDDDVITITEAYKKTIKAVLTLQIKDLANKTGAQLFDELSKAFSRYNSAKQKTV